MVDSVLGRAPFSQAPYVGVDAFATKAGLHASAIRKEPATYEHVDPALVGNQRRVVVAGQAGRSNVLAAIDRLKLSVAADDDRISALVDQVKRHEAAGFAFDLGEASLDLRILAAFGQPIAPALALQETALREAGKPGLHLTITAKHQKIDLSGSDLFELVRQAVLAFYPEQGERIAALHLTLQEQRFIDTGASCLFRAVVQGQKSGTTAWRTVGVGQSPIAAMIAAVDDALRYALTLDP